jgi:hypothetical protein
MAPKKTLPPPPQNKDSLLPSVQRDMATPPPSSPALPAMPSSNSTIRSRSNSNTSDDCLAVTPTSKRGRIIEDNSDSAESDQGPSKKINNQMVTNDGKAEEEKLRYFTIFPLKRC